MVTEGRFVGCPSPVGTSLSLCHIMNVSNFRGLDSVRHAIPLIPLAWSYEVQIAIEVAEPFDYCHQFASPLKTPAAPIMPSLEAKAYVSLLPMT